MPEGFAVDLGDTGSEYERGVNMPSTASGAFAVQGVAAIGKGVFDILDQRARGAQTSESAASREAFATLSKRVGEMKGLSPLKKQLAVKQAIIEYNNAGYDIGEAEARLFKHQTGVNVDYLNVDPQMEVLNKVNEQLSKNPAHFLIAKDKLIASGNQNPTQEEIYKKTISMISQIEAASLISSNAQTMGQAEWDASGRANAVLALDNLRELGLKTLDIEIQGGNVNPETLQQLKAAHIQLKNEYIKPAYISDDSYQGVKNRLEAIGELITTIETYDTNQIANLRQGLLNKIDLGIIKQIEAEGISNPLVSRALLANMDKVTEVLANKNFSEIATLVNGVSVDDLNFQSVEIFDGLVPETETSITSQELTTTDTLHHPIEVEKATERNRGDRQALINHGVLFNILALEPAAMVDENARKNFLQGIDKVTLNVATSQNFIDDNSLWSEEGLFSPKTYELLKKVEQFDPDAVKIARQQMKNAIQAQADLFLTSAKGATENNIFTVKGLGKIGFKDNAQLPPAVRSGLVQSYADLYYDGNMFRMIKDNFTKLDRSEKTKLRGEGFDVVPISKFYNEINNINQMVKRYADNYRLLGGDSSNFEKMLLIKQELGTTEAPAGSIAKPWDIPWSDDFDTDDKFFANLPSGTYYVDINGDTRRKP